MRDHRGEPPDEHTLRELVNITDQVEMHRYKHPASVQRSQKAKARAAAKRAKASRRTNR